MLLPEPPFPVLDFFGKVPIQGSVIPEKDRLEDPAESTEFVWIWKSSNRIHVLHNLAIIAYITIVESKFMSVERY